MTGEGKPALRARFRALRAGLAEADRAAAEAEIHRRILAHCASRRIRRLAAFWPVHGEVDLRPLVRSRPDLLWLFPKVTSTSPPRLAWGTEPLEPGPWGLMEPAFAQHFVPPADLLLVPGLAFDRDGYRLGYGGGFYDALLDHLDRRIPALGVAFAAQRVDRLPREPRDLPVDGLCTEAGLVWVQPPDGED